MENEQIAELMELEKRAAAAPWREARVYPGVYGAIGIVDADGDAICNTGESLLDEYANAALIVAMRNALPGLIELFNSTPMQGRLEKRALIARAEKAERSCLTCVRLLANTNSQLDAADEDIKTLSDLSDAYQAGNIELAKRLEKAEAERDLLAELAREFADYGTCDTCPAVCSESDCVDDLLKWSAQEAAKREGEKSCRS